jgi:rhodanese-related sulfurtransferase
MATTKIGLKQRTVELLILFASLITIAGFASPARPVVAQTVPDSTAVAFITVDDLKARLAKDESLTIIDVRASNEVLDSGTMIKGAAHVKLRKLQSRLALPPLKDLSRDREIITYCACPNDEASVRAAQVLMEAGFRRVRVLKGGWVAWKKAKGQVEPVPNGM